MKVNATSVVETKRTIIPLGKAEHKVHTHECLSVLRAHIHTRTLKYTNIQV